MTANADRSGWTGFDWDGLPELLDMTPEAVAAMLDTLRPHALDGDDFCRPITRTRNPRTWLIHDVYPKECYL
ncbi:MAG: hypothetical protein AB1925_12610 [Actinomycetota bacterium]